MTTHSHQQSNQQKSATKTKKSAAAFRTISEVAEELDVQQHVLRFWETKFAQVKPMKRGGGRRFYRPEDVDLLKAIHTLLYAEGYTIKGVQKLLAGSKNKVLEKLNDLEDDEPLLQSDVKPESRASVSESKTPATKPNLKSEHKQELTSMLDELKSLRALLRA